MQYFYCIFLLLLIAEKFQRAQRSQKNHSERQLPGFALVLAMGDYILNNLRLAAIFGSDFYGKSNYF